MTQKISCNLIGGPSKFDLMLGLFDDQTVVFRSSGQVFEVIPETVQALKDNGHSAWKIKGFFRIQSSGDKLRRCSIIFSHKDRKGALEELAPENKKDRFEYLEQLSDVALQDEINSYSRLAQTFRRDFDEYVVKFNPHDRLVMQARLTKLLANASLHTTLEYNVYLALKKQQG